MAAPRRRGDVALAISVEVNAMLSTLKRYSSIGGSLILVFLAFSLGKPVLAAAVLGYDVSIGPAVVSAHCEKKDDGSYDADDASCGYQIWSLPNAVIVRAEASANGCCGLLDISDAAADFDFKISIPYSYRRLVGIDSSGPFFVVTAPEVGVEFEVEYGAYIAIDGNSTELRTVATASAMVSGTEISTTVLFSLEEICHGGSTSGDVDWRCDSGADPEDVLESAYGKRTLAPPHWSSPVVGDTLVLTEQVCGPGEALAYGCDLGNVIYLEERYAGEVPVIVLQGDLEAGSLGGLESGGETLACLGLGAPDDLVPISCIFLTTLWGVPVGGGIVIDWSSNSQGTVSFPVVSTGENEYRVLSWSDISVPEPPTFTLLALGLLGVGFARRRTHKPMMKVNRRSP